MATTQDPTSAFEELPNFRAIKFLASILISKNINYPFILALTIGVIAILFFRIKDVENRKLAV